MIRRGAFVAEPSERSCSFTAHSSTADGRAARNVRELAIGLEGGTKMGMFYVDTGSGEFATHSQLPAHGALDQDGHARPPWHRVQATSDASTLWYALRKRRTASGWER